MGKGENAGYKHFLIIPICFHDASWSYGKEYSLDPTTTTFNDSEKQTHEITVEKG